MWDYATSEGSRTTATRCFHAYQFQNYRLPLYVNLFWAHRSVPQYANPQSEVEYKSLRSYFRPTSRDSRNRVKRAYKKRYDQTSCYANRRRQRLQTRQTDKVEGIRTYFTLGTRFERQWVSDTSCSRAWIILLRVWLIILDWNCSLPTVSYLRSLLVWLFRTAL